MRHYEIVFIVHPDQSEQVPAMIERYKAMIEAQEGKVKFVHEYIDHSHWIIFGHVVVQEFGQQRALATILACNKALHFASVLMRYWLKFTEPRPFTRGYVLHSLGRQLSVEIVCDFSSKAT